MYSECTPGTRMVLGFQERELQYILSSENVYVLCAGITYKLPIAKIERYFYFYLTG
jgi:hypothetical protein